MGGSRHRSTVPGRFAPRPALSGFMIATDTGLWICIGGGNQRRLSSP